MGVKLMTGATGEQNIQAADDRECLAGITGLESYVFPTGNKLKATLVDANTVTIGTGAGSLQGSRFRCSTTTTVNIQSGTQGQFRHDIVGLHFSRETSGREGLEFQVLTGEPAASEGAAADPTYAAGDLLKGDAEAFMPLYRIKLNGINAADPEPMFSVLTPLATLGDSVSLTKDAIGWHIFRISGLTIASYAYADMLFSGGNEYMRAASMSLPAGFTEPPKVFMTKCGSDNSSAGVSAIPRVTAVTKSNVDLAFTSTLGSLPSPFKQAFSLLAIGM